jgi:hypothetical protein
MKLLIDPPMGWKYGFPMEMPKDVTDETVNGWLISKGYPKELVDQFKGKVPFRVLEIPNED